jgi:hypothetical protein
MMEEYLQALRNSAESSRFSEPIITADGVDFRTIIGREELQHLVAYKLPDTDTFRIVTKDWLRDTIGDERYTNIFGDE